MKERKILEEWLYKINNFETNTVQYYDYIKKDIQIDVYNDLKSSNVLAAASGIVNEETGRPYEYIPYTPTRTPEGFTTTESDYLIYSVQLIGAYPLRLESTPVSWDDTDQLMKTTCTFTYQQLKFLKAEGFKHNEKVFV